jgi:hypothetical protein
VSALGTEAEPGRSDHVTPCLFTIMCQTLAGCLRLQLYVDMGHAGLALPLLHDILSL